MSKKILKIFYCFVIATICSVSLFAIGGGKLISKKAVVKAISSKLEINDPPTFNTKERYKVLLASGGTSEEDVTKAYVKAGLYDDEGRIFGFYTQPEDKPWIIIDLKKSYSITGIKLVNRIDGWKERCQGLKVLISSNNKKYKNVATAEDGFDIWETKISKQTGRYVKLMLNSENEKVNFHLAKILIYGR